MISNSVRNLTRTRKTRGQSECQTYRPRFGEQFALEADLGHKCRQLAEIEADLAATQEQEGGNEGRRAA